MDISRLGAGEHALEGTSLPRVPNVGQRSRRNQCSQEAAQGQRQLSEGSSAEGDLAYHLKTFGCRVPGGEPAQGGRTSIKIQ